MSGWLLMGLPGSIYALGTGQAWIAIGLFIGTVLNWIFISGRLRRYTIRANNSLTLPTYFENRFHDKKKVLLFISSVTIVIFFLVYTASALAAGGKLFTSVFNVDYKLALTIGAVVILTYTFLGGFMAVCVTDFVQGTLMLIALLAVPIMAYSIVGGGNVMSTLDASGVAGGGAAYLSLFSNGGEAYKAVDIISGLAWGLGYMGMPHILIRYISIKSEKEMKKSRIVGTCWTGIILVMASVVGMVGLKYLGGGLTDNSQVFIRLVRGVFPALVAGILLSAILAASMSTADSQLLASSSAFSSDVYKPIFRKSASDKEMLWAGRIVVIIISVVALAIAMNPDCEGIMALVSNAWGAFGSAFGPVIVLSLYWKRLNYNGALASIIVGFAVDMLWYKFLATPTGLYEIVPGFAAAFITAIVVSLLTKKPDDKVVEIFEKAKLPTE